MNGTINQFGTRFHGQCWLVVACCLLLVERFVCFVVLLFFGFRFFCSSIRYRIPMVSVGWLLLCCFLVWCLWMLARFFLQLSTGTLLDRRVILGGGVVGVVGYPLKMTTSG